MLKIKLVFLVLLNIIIISCAEKKSRFPVEARYWTPEDYRMVIQELRFAPDDEELPMFDNPETRLVVQKLTDDQNYMVVLDDKELGLKYKTEVGERFFNHLNDMNSIYTKMNRKDKYLYEKELIAVMKFGLGLQLKCFELWNKHVLEFSDDPTSYSSQNTIERNTGRLIKNYQLYFDEINNEKAFSPEGIKLYSQGIDNYFPELIKKYPDANYKGMKQKIEIFSKKTKSPEIKNSLSKILKLINPEKIEE